MPIIEELYAFIAEDSGPDDEGVLSMPAGSGDRGAIWLPLVGADMARIDSLRPIVRAICRGTRKKVTLVHFSNREDLEVINES